MKARRDFHVSGDDRFTALNAKLDLLLRVEQESARRQAVRDELVDLTAIAAVVALVGTVIALNLLGLLRVA